MRRPDAAGGAVTDLVDYGGGQMWLAATSVGLCRMEFASDNAQAFFDWLERRVGGSAPDPVSPLLREAGRQLRAYFAGRLRAFDLPLDLRGTPFQQAVWEAVAGIPYGQTTSYGQLAAQIGRPGAARAVGAANGANPLPVVIPCHRVVGSDGSLCGYGGGLSLKRELLRLERSD